MVKSSRPIFLPIVRLLLLLRLRLLRLWLRGLRLRGLNLRLGLDRLLIDLWLAPEVSKVILLLIGLGLGLGLRFDDISCAGGGLFLH